MISSLIWKIGWIFFLIRINIARNNYSLIFYVCTVQNYFLLLPSNICYKSSSLYLVNHLYIEQLHVFVLTFYDLFLHGAKLFLLLLSDAYYKFSSWHPVNCLLYIEHLVISVLTSYSCFFHGAKSLFTITT